MINKVLYLPETRKKSEPTPGKEAKSVGILSFIHFAFLFIFSGMEFTLTFLTFDRFKYSSVQQGKLLAYMGILSALVQGGYVRRVSASPRSLVLAGIVTCVAGLLLLSFAIDERLLYIGISFLAFTSGTVVNSLNSLASLAGGDQESGKQLGIYRSWGQLGRAFGPLSACSGYWTFGSASVYSIASISMVLIGLVMWISPSDKKRKKE